MCILFILSQVGDSSRNNSSISGGSSNSSSSENSVFLVPLSWQGCYLVLTYYCYSMTNIYILVV